MSNHLNWLVVFSFLSNFAFSAGAADLPWIVVAANKLQFTEAGTGKPFYPTGFNYDHDDEGRLIEDYWETEWPRIEADFAEMKSLGGNVVRVHLQFGKFMANKSEPNDAALNRLSKLVLLAETTGIYLDLTGLGCYHKRDVPGWYDQLSEAERWDAQCLFWQSVAARCVNSPAIFCYDLMNEPVVPGGRRKPGDWLGPDFAGKHFVQFITLDQTDRPRHEIAKQWIDKLVDAIRIIDQRHLITVGLVDWSLDRPGLTSGFVPSKVAERLDFIAVHIYPEKGKVDEALATAKGFAIGKPIVVEETFPLRCPADELLEFMSRSKADVSGWISFYWGKTPDELRKSGKLADAIVLDWLTKFPSQVSR